VDTPDLVEDVAQPERQVPPETPAERTDNHLQAVTSVQGPTPGTTIKLSIPGAVNLPDLPPLPMVEPRPGEDLFRPQLPAAGDPKPSLPTRRRQGSQEQQAEPRRAEEPEPVNGHEPPLGPPPQPSLEEPPQPDETRPQPQALPSIQEHAQPQLQEPQSAQQQAQEFAPQVVAGRPPLPQRRRQQNLAPQLREEPAPAWPQSQSASEHGREANPEQARSRLAAFQAGSRRGRHAQESEETSNGRSAGNGQHRSE
jgi:hypothetical protein